jgi:outer membrane protein assembly factor BamC
MIPVKQTAKLGRRLGWIGVMVALSACSVLESDKVDYKSAGVAPTLEVPPDLTKLSTESRYKLPGGSVTASGYAGAQAAAPTNTVALTTVGDVRIERSGNQRWLVINRTPEQLWGPVRDFWQESGFLLTVDQPDIGILETDWAENRAKIPQDAIRATLGKLIESAYSTAERDKFRTRMERQPSGSTEIFISHRGMIEVYTNKQQDGTVWQPRPADPELEAEFLRRLMIKLGVPQEQSKALIAAGASKPTARLSVVDTLPVVQIDDSFDRAWRRVGLALDRTGFTVEDRDRAKGIYFVRYVEPNAAKEPGFIGKLFGATAKESPPLKYRIAVRGVGDTTSVSVLNATGAPDNSDNAKRILQVIVDDLK